MIKWAERYIERGFACHWLHGKAPFQKDWSTKPVATLEELKRSYVPGNSLGVRVGKWSTLARFLRRDSVSSIAYSED